VCIVYCSVCIVYCSVYSTCKADLFQYFDCKILHFIPVFIERCNWLQVLSMPTDKARYVSIKPVSTGGILILKDTKPGEEEKLVEVVKGNVYCWLLYFIIIVYYYSIEYC